MIELLIRLLISAFEERGQPPRRTTPPQPPGSATPTPAARWEEELRRMLAGNPPPQASNPAPLRRALSPVPPLPSRADVPIPSRPFRSPPPAIDQQEETPAEVAFNNPLQESKAAFKRGASLQEQIQQRLQGIVKETENARPIELQPALPVTANRRIAANLVRNREQLRASFLASIILARPRCEELFLVLLLLCPLLGCTKAAPTPTAQIQAQSQTPAAKTNIQTFVVEGVVQEVQMTKSQLVVQHQKIPGYMDAMTMPFEVKNTNELTGVVAGDQIRFNLLVGPDEGWIERIEKLGRATGTNAPPEHQSVRLVRDVDPLSIGDKMPDYSFTNALGKKFSLSDFKGQALAFTFIFTRCPFPNFCPRMNSNFAQIAKKLSADTNAPPNWHLASISFDPEFDTPERLRNYSQVYNHFPEKWDFATGAMIDIDAITEQFGLSFVYREGTYDHKLRTVVVDARGVIQQIYVGNEWKVDDIIAEIKKAAAAR